MLMLKRMGLGAVVAGFAVLGVLYTVAPANAASTSNDPSAILIWPKIVTNSTGVCVGGANAGAPCTIGCGVNSVCRRTDTLVEIAHAGTNSGPVAMAHCFYINGNSHCSNNGNVCATYLDCEQPTGFFGSCVPGCSEYNFDVRISPAQPLGWSALEGLSGGDLHHPANRGTRVPPVPEDPFIGELKCIQVDEGAGDRLPAACDSTNGSTTDDCRNDLIGQATIENVDDSGLIDPATYSAIGLRANTVNSDGTLVLGGTSAEYDSCPLVLIFDHLFDGAIDPITDTHVASSELTLAQCSEDLLTQTITPVTAQFLVYNEFEQRFSTSRQVNCVQNSPISLLDTSQPDRSIFSAGVAGTVAGQTRILGVNGGLLGVATLAFTETPLTTGAPIVATGAYNLNQQAERELADTIRIPSGSF